MKEIVGARIGNTITNNKTKIRDAVANGTITHFLDRKHMQFMAACDLGRNWDLMASGPTLFCIDDKGNLHAPTTNLQQD